MAETVPPELFISIPNMNYIVDVPSVILSGKTVDATSGLRSLVCVSTSLGEVQIPMDEDGAFSMVIPLNVGRNDISVTSTNEAGLSTTSEFFMIRLITDRTQEDMNEIVRIMSTPTANWTEEEREIYLRAMARGSYDYVDMNRVTEAMDYLDQRLRDNGIESGYSQIKPVWYEEDVVYPSVADRYLANVEAMRSSIVPPENTPEAPADMEGFTFQEANDIEKILVLIDSLFYYIDKGFWYSDEIFCGEE